jgi:hypothetical protein
LIFEYFFLTWRFKNPNCMKKLKTVVALVAVVALFATSACTRRYTCPTYLKEDGKQKQDIRC